MLKKFYPYEYAEDVFSIDYQKLYDSGIKAVIFDIDGTLVPHGDDSTEEIDSLFEKISRIGLKTLLLSNNSEERIQRFNKNIKTLFIAEADKPEIKGYLKALEMLGVEKSEAVVIGDQLFTDVMGANAAGIPSVLVKFRLHPGDTKLGKKRRVEQVILKFYFLKKSRTKRLGDVCLK